MTYEEKIKNILTNIKVKRTKLGYSQNHIADQLGISQNMYSKIELGKTQITACKFLKICDLLEIQADELLNDRKAI
jgi:transcriptional regulator with XRE-family HTH domain